MLINCSRLVGFAIRATDGDIGKVFDLYFDDQEWISRYVVIDTGGWLAGRRVLVSPVAVNQTNSDDRTVFLSLTREQIENSPPASADAPISRQHERELVTHYGWPAYWDREAFWAPPVRPGGSASAVQEAPRTTLGDPHLRSVREVTGYYIEALDGTIGHVDDFLVDDETWAMRYMVVDTRNWWPGKKVLIAPNWIDRVNWDRTTVAVDLRRETIRSSPEYDPDRTIDRDYETRLFEHYERPHYWV